MNGFAKVHVRAANALVTPANVSPTRVTDELVRRATSFTTSKGFATISDPADDRASSGLTPAEVGISLAVLLGAFVLVMIVGFLCKVYNKPKEEAAPYVQSKLFQPSAAGYGSRSAMRRNDLQATPSYSARASLLGNAGMMGYSGGGDLIGESSGFSQETHSAGDSSFSRGHGRAHSSGIQLPGATAPSSRRGGGEGARHPMTPGEIIGPDGSGFRPYASMSNGDLRSPSNASTSVMSLGASAASQVPSHARVGLGPPPATDARRRSRYSRGASRVIDSMGPGQLRKSMYMGMEDDAMNPSKYADRRSRRMSRKYSDNGNTLQPADNNLRRVDSVGKGDHRRRSMHRNGSSSYNLNRGASIYSQSGTNSNQDRVLMRSAQADNFGAGRPSISAPDQTADPLNASKTSFLKTPDANSRSQGNTRPLVPSRQYSNQSSPVSNHSDASLMSSPNNTFLSSGEGASSSRGATPSPTPMSAAAAAAASGGYFGSPTPALKQMRQGYSGHYPQAQPHMQMHAQPGAGRQIV